jgi:hypothetical protein
MRQLDFRKALARHAVLASIALFAAGCTSLPYQYCGTLHTTDDAGLKPDEVQIERGRKAPVVDTVGWVVGVPAKILMFDRRVANHNVSAESEATIHDYLAANGLDRVKVRVNQYDPVGEWHRLVDNKSVAWPLRYTFGTLSWAGYTLLPGRVFGGDDYNPFTNTISLYSDVPAIAIYEGGRAKDYAQREYKGLYAVAYEVPGVGLVWHDARASSDAISYLQQTGTPEQVREGYCTVYPAYCIDASQPFGSMAGVPLVLPAALAGHVVGHVKAAKVPATSGQASPDEEVRAASCAARLPPARASTGSAAEAPVVR